jgi:hypothetical protein
MFAGLFGWAFVQWKAEMRGRTSTSQTFETGGLTLTFPNYSERHARIMSAYAAFAYCSDTIVRKHFKSDTYDVRFADVKGYRAIIVKNKFSNHVVISTRGTSDLSEIVSDAKFALKLIDSCSKCKVHTGFWEAHDELWPIIKNKIDNFTDSTYEFTGHSFGAALTILFAYRAQSEGMKVSSIYTFGQPLVGNSYFNDDFTKTMKVDLYRIVHWEDPVPRVPPISFGYDLQLNEVWYTENFTKYVYCETTKSLENCSYKKLGSGLNLPDDKVTDHTNYFDNNFKEPLNPNNCNIPTMVE